MQSHAEMKQNREQSHLYIFSAVYCLYLQILRSKIILVKFRNETTLARIFPAKRLLRIASRTLKYVLVN